MDYEAAVATFFRAPPEGTAVPGHVLDTGPARRLRDAIEPLAMHDVWAQESFDALAPHGLDFLSGYIGGRAAPLGDVPAAVVTAAFAVFPAELIEPLLATARVALEPAELLRLRAEATGTSLRKVLADVADESEVAEVAGTLLRAADAADGTGRPLFSALRAAPRPDDAYAGLWRAADLVREHRGDGHIAACVAAGLGPCEMNIITELWVGYSLGEYSNTRGWSRDAIEQAIARLTVAGLVQDWQLTEDGRAFRTTIEQRTDAAQRSLLDALGDELGSLLPRLTAWSDRCVAAGVFPADPRKRAAG